MSQDRSAGTICLSFDTDHMNETQMRGFLSVNCFVGRGTFFCTQRFDCLAGTDHEQAPHPFLNPGSDWEKELSDKRREFPLAKGWRSHSCVFSNMLAVWLGQNGYEYASTHDQFGATGITPLWNRWGVWHLPIYYMDAMDFSAERFGRGQNMAPFDPALIRGAIETRGLYVFDFHPIHIMLNTPSADYYLDRRDRFRAGEPIRDLRYSGYGTANFFQQLCREIEHSGLRSIGMGEALSNFRKSDLRASAERMIGPNNVQAQ
jgi:hypothetical protein